MHQGPLLDIPARSPGCPCRYSHVPAPQHPMSRSPAEAPAHSTRKDQPAAHPANLHNKTQEGSEEILRIATASCIGCGLTADKAASQPQFPDHQPPTRRHTGRSETRPAPVAPPSSLRHLLRQGDEGQEGFDRQAGPAQRSFQRSPPQRHITSSPPPARGRGKTAKKQGAENQCYESLGKNRWLTTATSARATRPRVACSAQSR
jgi:hypothetical protein